MQRKSTKPSMRITLWFAALCIAGVTADAAADASRVIEITSADSKTAVVELYTSEGCSSCPPADEYLRKLGASIAAEFNAVPLAFHVDYWNYLGWPDPYSKPAFTARQRQAAANNRRRSIYTPAFFVDGVEARAGRQIIRAIEAANAQPAQAQIKLRVVRIAGAGGAGGGVGAGSDGAGDGGLSRHPRSHPPRHPRSLLSGGGDGAGNIDGDGVDIGDIATLGIRPEDFHLDHGLALFELPVARIEHLGETQLVYFDLGDAFLTAKFPGHLPLTRGDALTLKCPPTALHLFRPNGAAIPRAT